MKLSRSRSTLILLLAISLTGCGESPPSATVDAGASDAATGTDDAGGSAAPQFVIHSAVQTGDGRTNYFTVVDSLGEAARLDYGSSLEVPGRARLYAEPGIGFFAIGDGEDVSVTRYELGDDGSFVAGDRLSFQAQGVRAMAPQAVLFVSATKAYYKDDDQAQIIVWNPAEMAVESVIELPAELIRADRVTDLSAWASRAGEAYFAVSWTTEEFDRVDPGTALVRIDTATDAITVTEDDRCRGLNKTSASGDALYFFSDVINGFGYAVYGDDGGQADCALRVLPGQTSFDAAYLGSMAPALGEDEIGTIISVTEDGVAWAQVVDTTMVPTAPGTTYSEWYGTGWRWVRLELATLADPVVVSSTPGAYSGFTMVSGSSFFVSEAAADYSESTLVDLSGDAPAPGVSFPGFVLDVARIR